MKVLAALALGVAMLLSASTAFAGDERGSDQDHGTLVVTDVIQTEPIHLGTVSGADQAPTFPYLDLRQENYER
jgi:hypothetical protein